MDTTTTDTTTKPTVVTRVDPLEKTTLKRTDDKPDNMIEGSDGPIIFPFAKIDDEFLRVHRNQLVHHNSEIAILVARKSKFNVSIKSPNDLREKSVLEEGVKHYFQWQFERLAQQMEEEERGTQSDNSVSNIQPPPDSMGVGEEALRFHRTARKLCEEEYANKFLLLVGHYILPLMKKPDFRELDLDEVLHILSSDYLGVPKERNVMRAAYAWLQHDLEQRKRHTSELMGGVRFGLLTKKEQIKCLIHNPELLSVLMNVLPFQRAFIKSCLWNYAQDAGLASQFKEFEDHPRAARDTYKSKVTGLPFSNVLWKLPNRKMAYCLGV